MSSILNGTKYSATGSRVPTDLLPAAIRYEAARAVIFEDWGNFVRANQCLALKRYYERRAMEECVSNPGPT
jgi:hypothetical protein|tara:strand:+ start:66 stop:278 length:213 start_codon:yes stop_codon:yes gene_type:complete